MRRRTTGAALLAAWLVALLTLAGGVAFAGSGGISPPPGGGGGGEDPPGDPPPACDDGAGASGSEPQFEVVKRDAAPGVDYPDDGQTPEFTYKISQVSEPVDLEVQVLTDDGSNTVVKNYCPEDVPPDQAQVVTWNHTTTSGDEAPKGKYKFKVVNLDGTKPATDAPPNHHFQWRGHIFPMHGTPHTYGDGWGAGRGHRGTDIFESGYPSPCGAPLYAARAGAVQVRQYQGGGAGYYLVIDGNDTNRDYVYMHIKGSSWDATPRVGETVQTGEKIAEVGKSGNPSACHLHFELWNGDWYGGGYAYDSEPSLRNWDSWS